MEVSDADTTFVPIFNMNITPKRTHIEFNTLSQTYITLAKGYAHISRAKFFYPSFPISHNKSWRGRRVIRETHSHTLGRKNNKQYPLLEFDRVSEEIWADDLREWLDPACV